jgi:DUF971 family protein
MPLPLDPRRKPAEIKVHVSTGAGVDIGWADGHRSHYDFALLREMCPCAMCNDERAKKQQDVATSGSDSSKDLLPMFKPKPRARAAKAIGNYALQIDFTDGHTTGIYSFEYLRTICPCDECVRMFGSTAP